MPQLGLFDKKQAVIRETRIIECWCPGCSKGQMKQLLDVSFKEKKSLYEFIGKAFVCEYCGESYEVMDVLSVIPEGFLIASHNEMSKVKVNNDAHQHLNSNEPYDGDAIMKDLERLNLSAEEDNKLLQNMLDKINATNTEDQELEEEQVDATVRNYRGEVMDILKACAVEGLVIKLPPDKLERKLYQDVAKAIELIGGKWKGGKTAGFVFKEDPTDLLAQIANGSKRNLKKEYQFFGTPDSLADKMVQMAEIKPHHTVLEPHGGQGAIIKAIHKVVPDAAIDTYELMELNRSILQKICNCKLIGDDFLKADVSVKYNRIVANPPFTKNQDIDHIYMMHHILAPGGIMVTLASCSWVSGSQKKQIEFREWLHGVGAHIEEVPEKTFKESGTNIKTMLIKIIKS